MSDGGDDAPAGGTPDAGTADAGTTNAGNDSDAGTIPSSEELGLPDAGSPEGEDAGSPDAGTDGGTDGGTSSCDRNAIIARADDWVSRGITYSQTDLTDGYRQDCSGFVSMCLGLPKPGANTKTLLTYGFTAVSKDNIQPGDILLNAGTHVVLFGGWANDDKTKYNCYEEPHKGKPARKSVTTYPYWSGSYDAYSYNKCN